MPETGKRRVCGVGKSRRDLLAARFGRDAVFAAADYQDLLAEMARVLGEAAVGEAICRLPIARGMDATLAPLHERERIGLRLGTDQIGRALLGEPVGTELFELL